MEKSDLSFQVFGVIWVVGWSNFTIKKADWIVSWNATFGARANAKFIRFFRERGAEIVSVYPQRKGQSVGSSWLLPTGLGVSTFPPPPSPSPGSGGEGPAPGSNCTHSVPICAPEFVAQP